MNLAARLSRGSWIGFEPFHSGTDWEARRDGATAFDGFTGKGRVAACGWRDNVSVALSLGIGRSSVSKWAAWKNVTGSVVPGKIGGNTPAALLGAAVAPIGEPVDQFTAQECTNGMMNSGLRAT